MLPFHHNLLPAIAAGLVFTSVPARALDATTPAAPPAEAPASELATACLRALRERRVVTFRYHGHERVLEPHALGVATSGEAVLHGYQTAGGTVSGKPLGWRTFALGEIQALTLTEQTFAGPRPDYAADRPKLSPLWGELGSGR